MKKLKIFGLIVAASLLTMKCSENELSPAENDNTTPRVYPADIMVFKTQEDFKTVLGQIKDYKPEAILAFSASKKVKTLYALLNEAEEKQEIIFSKNQHVIKDIKAALNMNNEVLAQQLSAGLTEQLSSIQRDYGDILEFRNNVITDLVYKDRLMASVLNREGMVIVADFLLQYSNTGIRSIAYEGPASIEKIKTEGNTAELSVLPQFNIEKENSSGRDDQMFAGYCNGLITTGNPYSYYDMNLFVVNTYVPVYRTERVWIPEECIEKPNGGVRCFPGYWEDQYVLDHYDLTNTRVNSSIRTRTEFCLIACFDMGGYSCFRRISISGYLNATVEETAATTTRSWDIGPYAHGSMSVTYGIAPQNIYREVCGWTVNW